MYKVFTRTFWKVNKTGGWPDNLEPHLGRKTTITTVATIDAARDVCRVWNANNKPGKLGRKAEFEEM